MTPSHSNFRPYTPLSSRRKKHLTKYFLHAYDPKEQPPLFWMVIAILCIAVANLFLWDDLFTRSAEVTTLPGVFGIPGATAAELLIAAAFILAGSSIAFWRFTEVLAIERQNKIARKKLEPKPSVDQVHATWDADLMKLARDTEERLNLQDVEQSQIFAIPFRGSPSSLMTIDHNGNKWFSEYEVALVYYLPEFIFFYQGAFNFISGEWTGVYTREVRYDQISAVRFERRKEQVRFVDEGTPAVPIKIQQVMIKAEGGDEIQFGVLDAVRIDLDLIANMVWRMWVIGSEMVNNSDELRSRFGRSPGTYERLAEVSRSLAPFMEPTGPGLLRMVKQTQRLFDDDLSRAAAVQALIQGVKREFVFFKKSKSDLKLIQNLHWFWNHLRMNSANRQIRRRRRMPEKWVEGMPMHLFVAGQVEAEGIERVLLNEIGTTAAEVKETLLAWLPMLGFHEYEQRITEQAIHSFFKSEPDDLIDLRRMLRKHQ